MRKILSTLNSYLYMLLWVLVHEQSFTNFSNYSTSFALEEFLGIWNQFEVYKRYSFQNELPMEYGIGNLSKKGVLI